VDDRVVALRASWIGHAADGGGGGAWSVGLVRVVEDGRAVSVDQYDADDREAMLARFAELAGSR
jgi:hypothetical protein